MFASYKKSGSPTAFPVANLPSEVQLIHLCACADTCVTKVAKTVSRNGNDRVFIGKRGALNVTSYSTPDVEILSKMQCMRSEWEIAKICEKQHRMAKMFAFFKKSGSPNSFPVTNLRPEVESTYLLLICRHYHHNSRRKLCRTPIMTARIFIGKLVCWIQISGPNISEIFLSTDPLVRRRRRRKRLKRRMR